MCGSLRSSGFVRCHTSYIVNLFYVKGVKKLEIELLLAPMVAVFTIIYFMPREMIIIYPTCVASIFSSIGSMYLASYIYNSMQTAYHVEEMEKQHRYYEDLLREEERVRSIYHDMKNHLLVPEAASSDSQLVRQSIEELSGQISSYEDIYTGNRSLDVILRDKARKARALDIDFGAVVRFEDGDFLDPIDISSIFGNALDNAIEACERLPQEERMITIKTSRIRDMLVIAVENNAASRINKSAGGILIESPWLLLRQRRKHQVFQIYAVNDWRGYAR